jgi:AcrR family transcriptional regulator
MESSEATSAKLGLRERKKLQTRETIADVALRLFAERGYDQTTLADIADTADISRRTIFAYYDSKEDILLCHEGSVHDDLKRRLDERPPGTTTVDAIRDLLSTIGPPDEQAKLRKRIIAANPELQMKLRARHAELEPILAASIAKDLDAGPDDIRPLLIAASMKAAFMSVSERFMEAEASGDTISHEQGMATLDQVLDFLRGGLEALQRPE